MESKYLASFQKLGADNLPLRGNRILVEVLPKEEIKSAGGLVLQSDLKDHMNSTEQNRAELALVLAVGPGYYNESTGEDEPLDIEPGNVILISRMGLKLYSQFPGLQAYTKESIALTRDTEAHVAWSSISAFKEYCTKLNS